jgi:hypothetical protein
MSWSLCAKSEQTSNAKEALDELQAGVNVFGENILMADSL